MVLSVRRRDERQRQKATASDVQTVNAASMTSPLARAEKVGGSAIVAVCLLLRASCLVPDAIAELHQVIPPQKPKLNQEE